MSLRDRIGQSLRPAVYLGTNPLTLAGAVITTSTALTLIGFWFFEAFIGGTVNPYVGLIIFLVLPGIFVLGLILMPAGALLRRHRLIAAGQLPEIYPKIDFALPTLRHAAAWAGTLSIVNILIFSFASYRGVAYMDTPEFCGQTCHTVMQPEFTAYSNSPHQRVECVSCHIGPGASWFVRSKLSGVRQVFAVTFHTYETPIPSPVKQLRPARETCEQCHWPQMFTGDKFLVLKKFSDDEKNTLLTTVLLLKVGGRTWQGAVGIHGRHLDVKSRIQYIATDHQRQVIAQVTYLDDSGKEDVYTSTDTKPTPQQLSAGEHRTMDCMDCHNRPTHIFQLPERAVDKAMSDGRISSDLPFIKKKAVEVLRADYPDRDTAQQKIAAQLEDFYRTSYPDVFRAKNALLSVAVAQVQAIYLRNVFPAMKVSWGTYPNNLGHQDFPGCFRCHDGSHSTADGRTIPNDCDTCHTVLAMEEQNPKVLTELGMK
jgi:nitrate/TMAO reductase-like tetraheme cytochrome c subunit